MMNFEKFSLVSNRLAMEDSKKIKKGEKTFPLISIFTGKNSAVTYFPH